MAAGYNIFFRARITVVRAVIMARSIPNIGIVAIINQLNHDSPKVCTNPDPIADSCDPMPQ